MAISQHRHCNPLLLHNMADFHRSQPLVIDNGTAVIKAGLAGEDKPRGFLPSLVGRTKHVRVMPGGALEGSSV